MLRTRTKKKHSNTNRRRERKMRLGKMLIFRGWEGKFSLSFSLTLTHSHTFIRSDILWKKWVTEIGKFFFSEVNFFSAISDWDGARIEWKSARFWKKRVVSFAIQRYGNWNLGNFFFSRYWVEWNSTFLFLHSLSVTTRALWRTYQGFWLISIAGRGCDNLILR